MDIKISIPRATAEELRRGLAAAEAVFAQADVPPESAARSWAQREAWDISGFRDAIEPASMAAAEIWDDADMAALDAACAGWKPNRKRPNRAKLALITDPETQLADRRTALEMLRSRAMAENGAGKRPDSKVADLAWIVAENLDDQFYARELVDSLTHAYYAIALRLDAPGLTSEQKRQALLDAIAALEKATETAH